MTERTRAATAAQKVLSRTWMGDDDVLTLPVEPEVIADKLGIEVMQTSFLEPGVSGAIEKEPGEAPVIYIERWDHPNRQRFTCAHELGHYYDRSGADDDEYGYIDKRGPTASKGVSRAEVFANAFAAELLMPAWAVRLLRKPKGTVSSLAEEFGVSADAMYYRLDNLQLTVRH